MFGRHNKGTSGMGTTSTTSTGMHQGRSVPIWTLPVRIVQFLLALLVLALCAHSRNYFGDSVISPGYSYGVFAGLFVMLVTIYMMVAACLPSAHHPLAILVLDALCLLFTTILWPLLAGYSGRYKNSIITAYYGDYSYVDYDYTVDQTSGWKTGVAAAVFGAFLWLLFILTTIFSIIHGRKAGFGAGRSHRTHGTGMNTMGGAGTAPVYGNNTGMSGAPGYQTNSTGAPGNTGMGQPAYNAGVPSQTGGNFGSGPNYNQGPMHNSAV